MAPAVRPPTLPIDSGRPSTRECASPLLPAEGSPGVVTSDGRPVMGMIINHKTPAAEPCQDLGGRS